ncbi:hypothetical protein AL542_08235 [Grimontia hollisae]|uniref:hypothetical protein n=1 Tax=Grimontia hollisae TaxID=673 RepID=UPI00058E89BE|nr:hypothetical protein [Grimontia hollisae]AMG30373.1 hypothetical protein AL542_08235 [Grimontia hollisae]
MTIPFVDGYWVLGTGYWVLGTGYWVLGTGYWVLGTGYWVRHDFGWCRNIESSSGSSQDPHFPEPRSYPKKAKTPPSFPDGDISIKGLKPAAIYD